MKRKVAVALAFATMTALTVGAPAFAHQAGPCAPNDPLVAAEPGHSGFAQHHIVPAAKAGALGEGGHKPGTHQGFSFCNPSGR